VTNWVPGVYHYCGQLSIPVEKNVRKGKVFEKKKDADE
jgi:hypothetical protein